LEVLTPINGYNPAHPGFIRLIGGLRQAGYTCLAIIDDIYIFYLLAPALVWGGGEPPDKLT
jgi:hypothetical protein